MIQIRIFAAAISILDWSHALHLRRRKADCAYLQINEESIKRFLLSPAFTGTFARLRVAHGMTLPLNFSSVVAELNVLSVLSLLNFASGYRVPLHQATGRGAFDNIRAFVFAAYISSSAGAGDYFSAAGMQQITPTVVADLMRLTHSIHVERPHESIPGVTVGELGGMVWEIVQIIARTMNETGEALADGGYPDLGSFVLEALKEGEKVKHAGGDECEAALERVSAASAPCRSKDATDNVLYLNSWCAGSLHSETWRWCTNSVRELHSIYINAIMC